MGMNELALSHVAIANTYFVDQKWDEALEWINKMLDMGELLRFDLRRAAKLLYLMAHFELKNELLIEGAVRSTYRFLYKSKKINKLDNLIFKFIRKSINVANSNQLKELYRSLKPDLQKLLKSDPKIKRRDEDI